jgi:hypothetical protein
MKLLEPRLVGKHKVVLTTSATAQADRWKATGQISDAQLWRLPYETLLQHWRLRPEQAQQRLASLVPPIPVLWKGRVLHLKGKFAGDDGAIHYYQMSRPSNRELENLAENYYQAALEALEQVASVQNRKPTEEELRRIRQATEESARLEKPLLMRSKQDASYWLGLISFHQKNFRHAIDYLAKRTLEAWPNSSWTYAARYNLARSYEASEQPGQAIATYRENKGSPAYFGCLLRARWLADLTRTPSDQSPQDQPEAAVKGETPAEPSDEAADMPEPSLLDEPPL